MKRKLTIGIFVDSFFPMVDGVAMVVDNQAKRLAKYANVIVFCPKYSFKEYNDNKLNYKVVRCISAKIPFVDYNLPAPQLDLSFEKKLQKYKLNIVHIHSPFTLGKIGLNYAKRHNIPVIGTMHSQYKQDFDRFIKLEKVTSFLIKEIIKIYDECDICFAVNKEVANIFYNDYGCRVMPDVMNNATEMKPILNEFEAYDYINNLYNIKQDEKVFLFVGRINALKNIFLIVDALKIVKKKKIFKFKMLFVGTGQDEKLLSNYIKDNNLQEDIILCGKVTDREILKYYYKRADLFLFPSLYDASSIVQIEAASQGTPGLFITGAATSSMIEDNVTGYLANNNDKDYAKRIIEIMNDTKTYNKVCSEVYNKIYVTWDGIVDKLFNIYKELIDNKNSK